MGFWIFMLVMDLLIPVTMMGFGWHFMKKPPKEINAVFGYRTAMSMKNKDTWDFAHRYCGRIWFILSLVMLPVSLAGMLLVLGKTENVVGTVGSIICFVQMIPMMAAIIPTERALKKNFHENGMRK